MNVAAAPRLSAAQARTQAPTQELKLERPQFESWKVGDRTYNSTADLVARFTPGGEPAPATYTFRPETKLPPQAGKVESTAVGAVVGAAGGAAVATAGTVILSGVGDFLGLILGGGLYYHASAAPGLAIPAAVGAVAGAALGAYLCNQPIDPNKSLSGSLLASNGHLNFYPHNRLDSPAVDLNQFAQAPEVHVDSPAAQPVWKDVAKGAGAGAGAVLGSFIPLVGLGAGAYVGSKAGHALTGHDTGGLLGGVAGLGLTIGTYASLNLDNTLPVLGGLVAGATVLGAALGPRVLPRLREEAAHAEAGTGQWWANATASDPTEA